MDEETANGTGGFKAPYMPFKTLWSFKEELGTKPLPPALDRSMLRTKSGTDQANLIGALKAFRLIDDNNNVQPTLRALVEAGEDDAKRQLGELLRANYPRQFDLSERNDTEKALLDSFEEDFGVTGDTKRKAATFFLQAARFCGITLSPHFPVTRLGSGRRATTTARATPRKAAAAKAEGKAQTPTLDTETPGETIPVDLGEGQSAVLTVHVRWLDLSDDKVTKLRKIVKDLRDLGVDPVADEDGEIVDPDEEEEPF